MSIGDNIKKYRKEKGLKQSELAEMADISRVAIGNYERGDRTPNVDILGRISLALDIPFKHLLDDSFEYNTFGSDAKKELSIKCSMYAKQGYLETKRLELLYDMALVFSKDKCALHDYYELLGFLTKESQEELLEFMSLSFRVKFEEMYKNGLKDDIEYSKKSLDEYCLEFNNKVKEKK